MSQVTNRKKSEVKDVFDYFLGSTRLMNQIAMQMLGQDEVLKTFAFSKRQVEIASSQSMGNYTDVVYLGQDPIYESRIN